MAFEILGEIPLSENIREMHPVTPEMVEVKKRIFPCRCLSERIVIQICMRCRSWPDLTLI